jgi:formylglycine-generating enzyme required for sulfatase activity
MIPAGEFIMGSDSRTDPYFWGAEEPVHTVYLETFYIHQTEVTNGTYAQCVAEKICPLPKQTRSRTRSAYYGNPVFDDYPVIHVTYGAASSYCRWAGGRLPTEAEWEKAARGVDGRLFPWGDQVPTTEKANYQASRHSDTVAVGSYLEGASPYGVLDMGGNVWEWVFDWFDPVYYRISPVENPQGPLNGERRIMRGGSWYNPIDGIRTVGRASTRPAQGLETLGFRCAFDVGN